MTFWELVDKRFPWLIFGGIALVAIGTGAYNWESLIAVAEEVVINLSKCGH